MKKRKAIAKSVRFEVFKRDKFTCQYCGAKAPDVILHVDHIHPVSAGGDNEIMNLATSCAACNSGKSDKKLSDQSALEKQRVELEALEERRQQLEMMMEWRRAAVDYKTEEMAALSDELEAASGRCLSPYGIKKLAAFRKHYEVSEILSAIDEVFPAPVENSEDFNAAFNRIPIICKWRRMYGEHGARYAYIQAILRNRFRNKYAKLVTVIHSTHTKMNVHLDEIADEARHCDSIEEFCEAFGFSWGADDAKN